MKTHAEPTRRATPRHSPTRRIAALPAAAALAALALAQASAATLDPSAFAAKIEISFPGYSGSETLPNFPVLVKLSADKGFQYAKCKLEKGGDLRFADENGNLLSSEVDTWDPEGTSLVWVKVPALSKTATVFAYYGWKGAGAVPAVSATDVWSEGYAAVWHLGGSASPLVESTGNATAFTSPADGVAPTYAANGIVGKAVDFATTDDNTTKKRLEAADCDALDGFGDFTVEFWSYQETFRDNQAAAILSKRNWGGNGESWFLYQNQDSGTWQNLILAYGPDGGSGNRTSGNAGKPPAANAWVYQVFLRTMSDDTWAWYWDGESVRSGTGTKNVGLSVFSGSATLKFGGGGGQYSFPGSIDEVRISSVRRSVDWITATRDTVKNDNFCSFAVSATWDDYSHRFSVTFPGVDNGVSLANFPVLVRVAEYDETTGKGIRGFDYDDCLIAGGGDLRFADADGNLLASEVDTWNTSGESLVWVRVPTLTASTEITAYYGCGAPHSVAASDVWANGYAAVWHLGESAAPLEESTGNATPFQQGAVAPLYAATGAVGGAVDFSNDGSTSKRLEAADADCLDGFGDFTVEFWSYQDGFLSTSSQYAGILAKRTGYAAQEAWFLYQANNSHIPNLAFGADAGATRVYLNASTLPPTGQWVHQAFSRTMSSGFCACYYDGTVDNSFTSTSAMATQPVYAGTAPLLLGGGASQNSFPGKIDEVRISNVVRDAAWLKATHDTVADAAFAAYGKAKENGQKGTVVFFR